MKEEQNEERLIEKQNISRQRITSNRLILITGVNVLSFVSVIFSICWYQWIWIKVQVIRYGQQIVQSLWINLLYIKIDGEDHYQSFQYAQQTFCEREDLYCHTLFLDFKFVGYLCFAIFMLGAFFQLFDLISMIYYSYKKRAVIENQDQFRHLTAIFSYFVGQTLFIFAIYFIQPLDIALGVSFWLNFGTIILFLVVIVYQQFSLRQLRKQQLILDLIQAQRMQNAKHIQRNIEMSSESEFHI